MQVEVSVGRYCPSPSPRPRNGNGHRQSTGFQAGPTFCPGHYSCHGGQKLGWPIPHSAVNSDYRNHNELMTPRPEVKKCCCCTNMMLHAERCQDVVQPTSLFTPKLATSTDECLNKATQIVEMEKYNLAEHRLSKTSWTQLLPWPTHRGRRVNALQRSC